MMDDAERMVERLVADATRIERERCLNIVFTKINDFRSPENLVAADDRLACIYLIDVFQEIAKDDFEHGLLEAGKILNGQKT